MTATVESPPVVTPESGDEPVGLARHVQDALALLLLAAVLVWLHDHDGGLELGAMRWVGLVAVLALPAVVRELTRLPRWVGWLLATWAAATVASVAFAEIRAWALAPLLAHAVVPIVFLAAARIRRRPWGTAAIGGLLLLAFGLYWHRSFLQWWGHTLNGQQPIWLSLSWRNQSGILMAAFGLLFTGVALVTDRVLRAGAVLLAGAAFAGVWLSSSRGSVVVTVAIAALVVGSVAWHERARWWRPLLATVAVGALAVGITSGLLAMDRRTEAASPLDSRVDSVDKNTRARLYHAEAALGMFVDRPVTGQGLGSYRETARPFTDPEANLTSSAHNEYAENLGEGGLPLGGAFLLANAAAVLAALLTLARSRDGGTSLERGLRIGAAGVVIAIAGHSALDFDWGYPVLPGLLAVGTALVCAGDRAPRTAGAATWAAGTLTFLLAAGAVVGTSAELAWDRTGDDLTAEEFAAAPSPLALDRQVAVGYRLWRDDRPDLAREVADRGLSWHPGATRLATLAAIADFELGDRTADELAGSLRDGWSRFDEYVYVAESLVDAGQLELAAQVLDRQRQQLVTNRRWGVTEAAQLAWPVVVRLEADVDGCDAAAAAAARAVDDEIAQFPDGVTPEDVLAASGTGC